MIATKTIVLKNTRNSTAIHAWMSKEYGSWEDHDKDINHACATLQRWGGTVTLTEKQAIELIQSGQYQSTGWDDDDILGGKMTKERIASIVKQIQLELTK